MRSLSGKLDCFGRERAELSPGGGAFMRACIPCLLSLIALAQRVQRRKQSNWAGPFCSVPCTSPQCSRGLSSGVSAHAWVSHALPCQCQLFCGMKRADNL